MVQLVYWGLEQYSSSVVKNATLGLVAQSRNLLMKNWYGYAPNAKGAGPWPLDYAPRKLSKLESFLPEYKCFLREH